MASRYYSYDACEGVVLATSAPQYLSEECTCKSDCFRFNATVPPSCMVWSTAAAQCGDLFTTLVTDCRCIGYCNQISSVHNSSNNSRPTCRVYKESTCGDVFKSGGYTYSSYNACNGHGQGSRVPMANNEAETSMEESTAGPSAAGGVATTKYSFSYAACRPKAATPQATPAAGSPALQTASPSAFITEASSAVNAPSTGSTTAPGAATTSVGDGSSDGSQDSVAIVGVVVGAILGVACIFVALACFRRYRCSGSKDHAGFLASSSQPTPPAFTANRVFELPLAAQVDVAYLDTSPEQPAKYDARKHQARQLQPQPQHGSHLEDVDGYVHDPAGRGANTAVTYAVPLGVFETSPGSPAGIATTTTPAPAANTTTGAAGNLKPLPQAYDSVLTASAGATSDAMAASKSHMIPSCGLGFSKTAPKIVI